MTPPREILDAIGYLSFRLMCFSDACSGTVPVRYSEKLDVIEISHRPGCECELYPWGDEAVALARFADEEIGRIVALGQYGEPDLAYANVRGAP